MGYTGYKIVFIDIFPKIFGLHAGYTGYTFKINMLVMILAWL